MAKLIGLPYLDVYTAASNLTRKIEGMKRSFGIPADLKGLGLDPGEVEAQMEALVESALHDACTKTNPRAVSAEDIENIIRKVTPL